MKWLTMLRGIGPGIGAALTFVLLGACQRSHGDSTVGAPDQAQVGSESIAAVPLGDVAGAAVSTLGGSIDNPYAQDAQAVEQGKELFVKMNCAGCHGYDAKGGMGPNLTDQYWRYGGVPVAIFKSIYEGRPEGMPAWNPALPPQEIWKLVAYIESLGGSFTPAQYQASIQGDKSGENVAAEAHATLSEEGTAKGDKKQSSGAVNVEARPDAGGPTPGSKP